MRLEYRLNDETKRYPALWNYANISNSEIIARMTCEYFIKDNKTYVVTATSVDPDGTAVIYIQKEEFTNDPSDPTYSHIGFEVRELSETSSSIIDRKDVWNYEEILPSLHSDLIYIQRDGLHMEFALDSREIDEDRKCYIYYGNFTGESR
ncbi:hypothetical protein COF07_27180 [Bacillus wiedmannii]|uniref:hypothetical protein n=1 Tax=Bacillus wiedmannii TaxID=1890302 RepID=UPI0008721E4C|nr:hypothetical protein [Bacillus wiedmannii]MED3314834.1 hypothetical protein [Bacillus wiedmannii]OFD11681.1 hypothetical protein BTGOE6_08540 [Bacillus wiedmannii]PFZ44100.1 hypothetical protein COL58_25095 [Bacillus wiedmannii]PGB69757.1 hypothetical protein COM12_07395 [Bacillus wiedmannii]PGD58394.1 hypothetical protein COM40_11245 [Bacillus wiedmannii]